MIKLRKYQRGLVQNIEDALQSYRRIVAQCPTGGGKTVIASYLIEQAVERGERAYFFVHRQELLDQTVGTFADLLPHIPVGVIAAGYPENLAAPVQVVSIDTYVRRLGRYAVPQLVLVDESVEELV